jgi:hypothetical protein
MVPAAEMTVSCAVTAPAAEREWCPRYKENGARDRERTVPAAERERCPRQRENGARGRERTVPAAEKTVSCAITQTSSLQKEKIPGCSDNNKWTLRCVEAVSSATQRREEQSHDFAYQRYQYACEPSPAKQPEHQRSLYSTCSVTSLTPLLTVSTFLFL